MTKLVPLFAFLAVVLTACSHTPVSPAAYTLTVDYHGSRVFGPSPVRMEDKSIPLDGTCETPMSGPRVLHLQLSEPIDGYFYYSCYTSCFLGTGEGSGGKIGPRQSVPLNCMEQSLQVTLHEG
jgi:hypothetical protein